MDIPIKVGAIIVSKMFKIVSTTSKWILFSTPINKINPNFTINGKVIRIIKLFSAVNEIDNAKFPLSICVIIFVADPPAHAVISTNPTFT